jgi:hypothetical protein
MGHSIASGFFLLDCYITDNEFNKRHLNKTPTFVSISTKTKPLQKEKKGPVNIFFFLVEELSSMRKVKWKFGAFLFVWLGA